MPCITCQAPIGQNNKVPDYQNIDRSDFKTLLFSVLELPLVEDLSANCNAGLLQHAVVRRTLDASRRNSTSLPRIVIALL